VPPLVAREDLKGLVHAHTDWSDGTQSLAEMAAAAAERGYTYLTVTDHSQVAVYANGLTPERVLEQVGAIAKLNAGDGPVRLLSGIEVDILPDGRLDLPDEVLAKLDVVIASVHSTFTQAPDVVTERILRAVRNPHVDILGHPTGRLLLRRGGYAVDMERVLCAAAEYGTAIELNASPWRLDLDPDLHARARDLGVRVPICPDAHAAAGMDDVSWGVLAARHGGLTADDVPNTRDADGFLEALAR
jgi:DNA polymerase (family 10)